MAEPTLDELVAFMKKHGVEKVDSITDEKSAIKHFRAASRVYKEERDSFRKQRDELIQDIAKLREQLEAKTMTNTLDQLVEQVQQWSIDKGLHNGNSFVQLAKFFEESGEVAAALCRNDIDALRDGIGDVIVTLVILAQQNNMTLYECLEQAYGEIKDRKGVMSKDGSFIKEADLKE